MPGARTHDAITVVTAAGAIGAYWKMVPTPDWTQAALFVAPYLFAGFACAGDLDLKSAEYRRWGPLRFLWLPYQKLVPHRSWVSHGLILGGLLRAFYLLAVFVMLSAGGLWLYGHFFGAKQADLIARQQWTSLDGFVSTHPAQVGLALAGFVLAGTVHSLSDAVFTFFKKLF
jgi:uncharacterized metal-binding protein